MREYSCAEEAFEAYEAQRAMDEDQAHLEALGCQAEAEGETFVRPTGTLTQCYRGGSRKGMDGWRIKFDYDPELIEELKASVNFMERDWIVASKEWWISTEAEGALKRLFPNFEAFKNQLSFLEGKEGK